MGGGDVNPRVRTEANPLPPDPASVVLPKGSRAGGKTVARGDAVVARTLASPLGLNVSRP